MAGRAINRKGRSKYRAFVMLRHDMMDSPAWLSLGPAARCVWTEVSRRYNSFNNGEIALSCREAAERIGVTKDTAAKAFNELIEKGFLRVGEDSSFTVKYKKSRRWILTHHMVGRVPPTNEWQRWKKQNTVR